MQRYLKELYNYPVLSNEVIIDHLKLYRGFGNMKSRETVIVHNLRLVVFIAEKYQNYGADLSELISEGNIGLIYSLDKFDFSMNVAFSTYATYWIKRQIFTYLKKNNTIYIPDYIQRLMSKWNEIKQELQKDASRTTIVTDDEISRIMNLPKRQLARLKHCMNAKGISSIDSEDSGSAANLPEKNGNNDILETIIIKERNNKIETTIEKMTPRDKYIIGERLKGKTLEKIGEELGGLTRERIRQLEKNIVEQLQVSLAE